MIKTQKSFVNEFGGRLYIVPTPIGNLEDMTYRGVRILKEVDLIAAEDTRQTRKLLNHFDIPTSLISYHEHNKQQSGQRIIEDIKEGKTIALVSDAGMPAISDPGYDLVKLALVEDIAVIPLPGANAALTALVASGLPTEHFYFYGFLHRQKKEKKKQLEKIKKMTDTIIFYESPHRLKETLEVLKVELGDRNIVLSRELSKKYEEFIRGSLTTVIEWAKEGEIKGEFCLIVEGSSEVETDDQVEWWDSLTVKEHVEHYISVKNMKPNEAVKLTAKDRGMQKREVYQTYHVE